MYKTIYMVRKIYSDSGSWKNVTFRGPPSWGVDRAWTGPVARCWWHGGCLGSVGESLAHSRVLRRNSPTICK